MVQYHSIRHCLYSSLSQLYCNYAALPTVDERGDNYDPGNSRTLKGHIASPSAAPDIIYLLASRYKYIHNRTSLPSRNMVYLGANGLTMTYGQ